VAPSALRHPERKSYPLGKRFLYYRNNPPLSRAGAGKTSIPLKGISLRGRGGRNAFLLARKGPLPRESKRLDGSLRRRVKANASSKVGRLPRPLISYRTNPYLLSSWTLDPLLQGDMCLRKVLFQGTGRISPAGCREVILGRERRCGSFPPPSWRFASGGGAPLSSFLLLCGKKRRESYSER